MRVLATLLLSSAVSMAEVPTITTTNFGPTLLPSPTLYPYTNSVFSYYGSPVSPITNVFDTIAGYIATDPTSTYYSGGRPVEVTFAINAQQFEVFCAPFGQNGSIQISDGANQSLLPTNGLDINPIGAHPKTYLCLVTYGSKAARNITVWLSSDYTNGCTFGGINVGSGDTISAYAPAPRVMTVLDDSYGEGYSQYAGTTNVNPKWLGSAGMQLSFLGSNVVCLPDCQGGTGYTNNSSTVNFTNYLARLPDIFAHPPKYLIIKGGYNDAPNCYGAGQSSTNGCWNFLTNCYCQCVSNLPNTHISVVSVMSAGLTSGTTINWLYLDALITNAAALYGIPWVSPLQQNWLNSGNQAGFIGPDTVHPTIAGYLIDATNMFNFESSTYSDFTNLATPVVSLGVYLPFRNK